MLQFALPHKAVNKITAMPLEEPQGLGPPSKKLECRCVVPNFT
jgi:hypothetical protein